MCRCRCTKFIHHIQQSRTNVESTVPLSDRVSGEGGFACGPTGYPLGEATVAPPTDSENDAFSPARARPPRGPSVRDGPDRTGTRDRRYARAAPPESRRVVGDRLSAPRDTDRCRIRTPEEVVHPGFEPGSLAPEARRIGLYPNGLTCLTADLLAVVVSRVTNLGISVLRIGDPDLGSGVRSHMLDPMAVGAE